MNQEQQPNEEIKRKISFFDIFTYSTKKERFFSGEWQNDLKKPNQIPKPWDIIIFSVPKSTWHIAVVYGATPWVNGITIFEQNWGRWSTTWQGTDACRLRKVTYANVYWWITW